MAGEGFDAPWLSPRVSFSTSFGELGKDARACGDEQEAVAGTDFEFTMALQDFGSVSAGIMLSADELFYKGKLLPLQLSPQIQMIEALSDAPSLKETLESPKNIANFQSVHAALEDPHSLNPPSSCSCSSPLSPEVSFAPPLSHARKCSAVLKDMFVTSNNQPNPGSEGLESSVVKSKLWRQLVRGVTAAGKRAGLSGKEAARHSPSPSLPSASSPTSAFAGSFEKHVDILNRVKDRSSHCETTSSSHFAYNTLQLELESLNSFLTSGKSLMGSAEKSAVASADDCSVLQPRRRGGSGRSVSVPSSRWSSPERDIAKSSVDKASSSGERYFVGSSGKVNSGRIILKNLERCSANQKAPVRFREKWDDMQHREYWRAPEKVTTHTSNVRVTPVLNVPVGTPPSVKNSKPTKSRFFNFKELFSSKKETPA